MKLKDEIMLHCGVTPQRKTVDPSGPDVDPRVDNATKLPFGHRVSQGKIHKKNLQDKFFVKDGNVASSRVKVVRRRKLRIKGRRRGIRLT